MSKKLGLTFMSVIIILLTLFIVITLIKVVNSHEENNILSTQEVYMEDMEFEPKDNYEQLDYKLNVTNDSSRFYINEQNMPTPIRVPQNTQLNVEVNNMTKYEISIHFHGILGMNKMDGVAGMTEGGIAPGETFTYRFNLDTPGTYMYHSHVDSLNQVNNEFLYGGLVVEDKEMQEAKNKEMLILNSKYNDSDMYTNNKMHLEYTFNNQDDIYLNIVNLSSTPVTYYFGDDIEWEIISVDANKTTSKPYQNNELYIPTANRVDVKIKNPKKSFVMYTTVYGKNNSEIGIKIDEEIDYKKEREAHFSNEVGIERFVREEIVHLYDIIESQDEVEEVAPDKTYELELDMEHMAWTINDKAYPNTDTIDVDYNDVVEVNLTSPTTMHSSPHPFHLHGHEFKVTRVNGQKINKNLVMDTVEVLPGDEITIQFVANNPGIWAFHCHNLEHAASGMMTSVNYNGYTTHASQNEQAQE